MSIHKRPTSSLKKALIVGAIGILIAIVLVGQIWRLPDLEDKMHNQRGRLPEIEIELFEVLRVTDSANRQLYDEVLENEQTSRKHAKEWKERIDKRAASFQGKKIGTRHPGQYPDFTPTDEYKPVLEEYEQYRNALQELDISTSEKKRELAREHGGSAKNAAAVELWNRHEQLLESTVAYSSQLTQYYSTPIGKIRKTIFTLSGIIAVVCIIGLMIGFYAYMFG